MGIPEYSCRFATLIADDFPTGRTYITVSPDHLSLRRLAFGDELLSGESGSKPGWKFGYKIAKDWPAYKCNNSSILRSVSLPTTDVYLVDRSVY
jgi:hypothetical protein